MMIRHDSKLTVKRYKSLLVKDFSQTVLNSILDKSHYMEEDIKNVYTHDDVMLKVDTLLRHIYLDHVTIRSAVKVESSTSFKASSLALVTAKPSPAVSKSARG
jgi:Sec7-like guanine-nucleotide exchange factor